MEWALNCWEMLVLGWVIGMPSWTPLRGQPQTARRSSRMASDLLRFSSFLGFLLISFLFFDTQLSTCLYLSPFYPLSLGWCHPVSLSDSRRSERCDCSSKVCPEITSRCTGIVNNRWRIQRRVHRVNDTEINRKKSGRAGGREETGKGRNWRFLTAWRVRENQQFIVFPDRPILSHEPCIHTHTHACTLACTQCIYSNICGATCTHMTRNVTVWHPWQFGVTVFWDPMIHKNNPIISLTLTWFITSFCLCPALVES